MSKDAIARVLMVATPERVPCGCGLLHMTVPRSAIDIDLEAARAAFPETHFERPNAYVSDDLLAFARAADERMRELSQLLADRAKAAHLFRHGELMPFETCELTTCAEVRAALRKGEGA